MRKLDALFIREEPHHLARAGDAVMKRNIPKPPERGVGVGVGVGVATPAAAAAARREFRPRAWWMALVVSLAFAVLAGRLYQLQILRGDEYKERADENFVKELRVPADRGFILDRSGSMLVDSRPSYDVTLTPYFCGKRAPTS